MTTVKNWEWADNCEPEYVTEHNVFQVHWLLNFPDGCNGDSGKCKRTSTCKNSPYCLNGTTPLSLFKSIKDSKKELEKLKEISDQKRGNNEYVGLDNLGATCYVNSYLQMWFHTPSFRHLILNYRPLLSSNINEDHDDHIETTIHEMRVLFAQMILTKKRSLLPDAFIETLGLDPNNQQDAQEFSNLWMSILQNRFGSSFSRLFGGSCDVSITCDACKRSSRKPDDFSELILNVPATEAMPQVVDSPGRRQTTCVKLEDVMRRYFGNEILDGDNAYECSFSNCNRKGKATRRTRLEKAPAILNAQILRFAFDPVKMTRKKLRTNISFPENLELRREYFADDSPELNATNLPRYRIKAILCHIGTSVVRGHYTARILLPDGWYMFNDAIVKKGDPTSGGDGGVDVEESSGSSGRRFRSADAYCIVYHRIDAPELSIRNADVFSCADSIPVGLRREVEQVEQRFQNELEKKRDDIMANSDAKEQTREQRLSIRNRLSLELPPRSELQNPSVELVKKILANQSGGGSVFVHKDFLTDYFSLKSSENAESAFGIGEKNQCEHGRLGWELAGFTKLIPQATAQLMANDLGYNYSHFIVFGVEDLCLTCIRIGCFEMYNQRQAAELTRLTRIELKQIDNKSEDVKRCNWIPREYLEKVNEISLNAISTAHRSLQERVKFLSTTQLVDKSRYSNLGISSKVPEATIVVINGVGTPVKPLILNQTRGIVETVRDDGPEVKRPKIAVDTDEIFIEKNTTRKSYNTQKCEFKPIDISSLNGSHNAAIPDEPSQVTVVELIHGAFNEVDHNFNVDTLCEHGNVWVSAPTMNGNSSRKVRSGTAQGLICVSDDLWDRISKFVPNTARYCFPDFKLCDVCGNEAKRERLKADQIREEAKVMSRQFNDLLKRQKRPKVETALRSMYLVSSEFLGRLSDFTNHKSLMEDRSLHHLKILCPHGRLPFTPDELADELSSDEPEWVATKGNEWKLLKDTFSVDVEVILKPVNEKLDSIIENSANSNYSWNNGKRLTPIEGLAQKNVVDVEEISSEDTASWEEADSTEDEDADESKSLSRSRSRSARSRANSKGSTPLSKNVTSKTPKSRRVRWECQPLTCARCRDDRVTQLAIKRSTPQPLVWDGVVYVRFENCLSESASPRVSVHSRRRRRVAKDKRKKVAMAGEDLDYEISSTCALVEFQMMIMDDFAISPFEQLVFVIDEDTKDLRQVSADIPEKTLGELQIRDCQMFVLRRKDEDDDEETVATAPGAEDSATKKTKSNSSSEGFAGTRLSELVNATAVKCSRVMEPSASDDQFIMVVEIDQNPNDTITDQHHKMADHDELASLLFLLRLPDESRSLLSTLFREESKELFYNEGLLFQFVSEVHIALLESSKSCLATACPIIAQLCSFLLESQSSTPVISNVSAFCAASLLELLPSLVASAFLYGSTTVSLLDTSSVNPVPNLSSIPVQTHNMPVPPSPPPSAMGDQFNFNSTPQRQKNDLLNAQISQNSPEYLLKFILYLMDNGMIWHGAGSFFGHQMPKRQPSSPQYTARLTRQAVTAGGSRTTSPIGCSSPGGICGQPSIHHFASLVAPSIYHNPVLFGASVISDQRERRVRILSPISSAVSDFDPSSTMQSPVPPGMVAPLGIVALTEFNRHHAANVNAGTIIRYCDAILRLLDLPVSSPSLQAVSAGVVLQLVYFVNIAASVVGQHSSYKSDDQLCVLKLVQVLHNAKTLAELRLWPDVLVVVKAVRNVSTLAADISEASEAVSHHVESAVVHPAASRAITNASFKVKKLADDIEVTAETKKQEVTSPSLKRIHGHHNLQNEQHSDQHGPSTNSNKRTSTHYLPGQFASHWRNSKHSAAIASLQAAFRLPEKLRSRRRSFGHDLGASPHNRHHSSSSGTGPSTFSQKSLSSTHKPSNAAGTATAGDRSFATMDDSALLQSDAPRLEMRILDETPTGGNETDSAFVNRHEDLPMIDGNSGMESGNGIPPRSRVSSAGHQSKRIIDGEHDYEAMDDESEDSDEEVNSNSSDTSENDEKEKTGKRKTRRQAFDPAVTESHAYLGEMEEVIGTTFLETHSFTTVPLIIQENLIILPGQTLPLHVYEPAHVRMMQRLLEGDKIFGVLCAKRDGTIATTGSTAEIMNIKQEHDPLMGITTLSVKSIGRQRFILQRKHGSETGVLLGDVKIIEDTATNIPVKAVSCHNALWALSSVPRFLWKAYDWLYLMNLVKERLSPWSIDTNLLPSEPSEFSFWVTGNLPFDDDVKLQLIGLQSSVQRLRMIYYLLDKCSQLQCVSCGAEISETSSMFTMSVRGPMGTFVNPHGWIHQMFTVTSSQGYSLRGRRTEQDSWFPGYAWTIMECSNCHHHLGWQFTSVKHKLEPLRFFGLCRRSVQPAISPEDKLALPF